MQHMLALVSIAGILVVFTTLAALDATLAAIIDYSRKEKNDNDKLHQSSSQRR